MYMKEQNNAGKCGISELSTNGRFWPKAESRLLQIPTLGVDCLVPACMTGRFDVPCLEAGGDIEYLNTSRRNGATCFNTKLVLQIPFLLS